MATRRRRSATPASQCRTVSRRTLHQRFLSSFVLGGTGQHAAECDQRLAHTQAATFDSEFSNRSFVTAASLFHGGHRLPDRTGVLEVAEQDDRVREIADFGGFLDRPAKYA